MPDASDRVHGRGYGRCSAIDCVRVSLSVDRCLMVFHQVCRVVELDRRKLIAVERCRSNHLVNNIVDAFHFMQERKCVYVVSSLKSPISNTSDSKIILDFS